MKINLGEEIEVRMKGGRYIIENMSQHYNFREGDIVYNLGNIGIVKHNYGTIGCLFYIILNEGDLIENVIEDIGLARPATKDEIKRIFDVMNEKGYRWNSEKLCVEFERWRAELFSNFWMIDTEFEVRKYVEKGRFCGQKYYEEGNYFSTKEEAEEVAGVLKRLFYGLNKSCWIIDDEFEVRNIENIDGEIEVCFHKGNGDYYKITNLFCMKEDADKMSKSIKNILKDYWNRKK